MPEFNPDVLKYGALGLMFVGLVLAGSIVFGSKDGAKPGQYRLLVTFMIFALVLVAAAVGSELFKTRAADQLKAEQEKSATLQSQVETLTTDAAAAATKLTEAQKAAGDFRDRFTSVVDGTKEQLGKLVVSVDGKWCNEVINIQDGNIRDPSLRFLKQMRVSIAAIQNLLDVAEADQVTVSPDCTVPG